jgi:hypothetical protein
MSSVLLHPLPQLRHLPATMPVERAICLDLEEGVPLLRASHTVQTRIEALLAKQRVSPLSADEEEELARYEEIDDYLSFLNRVVRNLLQPPDRQES